MYTTTDERGLLNNYATEPAMYYAEFPSVEKQQSYAKQGAIAALLVSAIVMLALSVS